MSEPSTPWGGYPWPVGHPPPERAGAALAGKPGGEGGDSGVMAPRPQKSKSGPPVAAEEVEQVRVARYLDGLGWVRWCHVPNGGRRGKAEGGRFKAMGVKAGVPDILVFTRPPRRPDIRGVAIEMKREGVTSCTEAQDEWLDGLRGEGWLTKLCPGAEPAIQFLQALGFTEGGDR